MGEEEQPPAAISRMDAVFIDPTSLKGNFGGICQLMELFIAYSYLLYLGCNMISDGAELLMLTPSLCKSPQSTLQPNLPGFPFQVLL